MGLEAQRNLCMGPRSPVYSFGRDSVAGCGWLFYSVAFQPVAFPAMSRRPRPVFEWPRDGQPLTFEVVVHGRSCCRGYTAPPCRGVPTGQRWSHGMRFDAFPAYWHNRDYVTVLTTEGSYVNVWARYNLRGDPVGVLFAKPVNNRQPGDAQQGGLAPSPSSIQTMPFAAEGFRHVPH